MYTHTYIYIYIYHTYTHRYMLYTYRIKISACTALMCSYEMLRGSDVCIVPAREALLPR